MIDLTTHIGGQIFKNPLFNASGTFNYKGMHRITNINALGALVTKSISYYPWTGNSEPRILELMPHGMLNSIGIQNKGVDKFIEDDLPILAEFNTSLVPSVAGKTVEEYIQVVSALHPYKNKIAALEINFSCPNIDCGYETFSTNPKVVEQVIRELKQITEIDIWAKLSPNVTDILPMVEACIAAKADAVVMINTLLGTAIDLKTQKPYFERIFAGYSGPAIKPIALRFVWQTYEQFKEIPIIAVGGISSVQDIAEFLLAGASAVQIGTMSFANPTIIEKMINDLPDILASLGASQLNDLIGKAHS